MTESHPGSGQFEGEGREKEPKAIIEEVIEGLESEKNKNLRSETSEGLLRIEEEERSEKIGEYLRVYQEAASKNSDLEAEQISEPGEKQAYQLKQQLYLMLGSALILRETHSLSSYNEALVDALADAWFAAEEDEAMTDLYNQISSVAVGHLKELSRGENLDISEEEWPSLTYLGARNKVKKAVETQGKIEDPEQFLNEKGFIEGEF